MDTGSMIITNYLRQQTMLVIHGSLAYSDVGMNSRADAQAALYREQSSPSPNPGNIAFLQEWLRKAVGNNPLEHGDASDVPTEVEIPKKGDEESTKAHDGVKEHEHSEHHEHHSIRETLFGSSSAIGSKQKTQH